MDLVKVMGSHYLVRYQDRQDLKSLKMYLDKMDQKIHLLPMDNRSSRRMSPLSKYVDDKGNYAVVIA